MKLLHSSDWHLGHTLSGRSRQREFQAFLDWILRLVETEKIDVFLLAGDVFDVSSPKLDVQKMYYDFLRDVSSRCPQTVIVAGNHDSPYLLDAPKTLLRSLRIHVVGAASPENELLVVRNEKGTPTLLVGAVPFLRDGDLRRSEAGESFETREQKSVAGLKEHYRDLCDRAEAIRTEIGGDIPLVVSGHLYVAGGKTSEGVRELQIGNLGSVGTDIFPENIDYLALGHLHVPQLVAGSPVRRYSGSPIPISFDEAEQRKIVVLVDFDGRTPNVREIPIPRFSNLVRLRGDLGDIRAGLKAIPRTDIETFVDVVYDGEEIVPDLQERIGEWTSNDVDVLQVRDELAYNNIRLRTTSQEHLEDLDPEDVFKRLLDARAAQRKKSATKKPRKTVEAEEPAAEEKKDDVVSDAELIAAFRTIVPRGRC